MTVEVRLLILDYKKNKVAVYEDSTRDYVGCYTVPSVVYDGEVVDSVDEMIDKFNSEYGLQLDSNRLYRLVDTFVPMLGEYISIIGMSCERAEIRHISDCMKKDMVTVDLNDLDYNMDVKDIDLVKYAMSFAIELL